MTLASLVGVFCVFLVRELFSMLERQQIYSITDNSSKNYICIKKKFYIADWIIISLKKDKNYSFNNDKNRATKY